MVLKSNDERVKQYGCKICTHPKVVREVYEYESGNKGYTRVYYCPFKRCPYFTGDKSFREYIDKEEYKMQFEMIGTIDMNDMRNQPGDVPPW